MSKPFNISPNQVKAVIIVSKKLEDNFLSFLFNLGYSWIERDFNQLSIRLEPHGIILIQEEDSRLQRLFTRLYNLPGVFYYCIGTRHLLTVETVDPFIHNIFVEKDHWKEFNDSFKNLHTVSFEQILEEVK